MTSTLASAMRDAERGFSSLESAASRSMSQLSSSVSRGMSEASSAINRESGRWPSVISSVAGGMESAGNRAGSAAGQGVVNGMSNMLGRIQGIADRIAAIVRNTIALGLSINSPSKVTTYFGEMVGQGLADGMNNMIRPVMTAANNIAFSTAETLGKVLNGNQFFEAGASIGAQVASGISSGMDTASDAFKKLVENVYAYLGPDLNELMSSVKKPATQLNDYLLEIVKTGDWMNSHLEEIPRGYYFKNMINELDKMGSLDTLKTYLDYMLLKGDSGNDYIVDIPKQWHDMAYDLGEYIEGELQLDTDANALRTVLTGNVRDNAKWFNYLATHQDSQAQVPDKAPPIIVPEPAPPAVYSGSGTTNNITVYNTYHVEVKDLDDLNHAVDFIRGLGSARQLVFAQ